MKLKSIFCLLIFVFSMRPAMAKEWLLEKLGRSDIAIARAYLDGFENVKPKERVLLYYLFRAAVAGRDIYYDQRHRQALEIRRLVESLLKEGKNPQLKEYAKYLWVHNGQYHARTGIKFTPKFSYEDLQKLAEGEDLSHLKSSIFDKSADPVLTNLTPKPEEGDILKASAVNIYDKGINLETFDDLPKFWKTKLNVRFALYSDKVVPQVYKIAGVYHEELSNAAYFLRKALPLTEGLQKEYLGNLIRYYETGDENLFKKASIAWLKSNPPVDLIHGFIESYMDPRQTVGSFEGIVYYTAREPVLDGFAANAGYFEKKMPWKEEFKRTNFDAKPVAILINVAAAAGEGGPVTWSGINLPNYQDIRQKHGSKNVVLTNMIEARNQVMLEMLINSFYLPEYRPLMKKYYSTARKMLLYMHEVIGHGSGKASSKLKHDPRDYIGKNYSAWEEARASLVAWHHINDPMLVEIGAFKKEEQKDVMKAMYLLELQGQMVQLRGAKHEEVLREAHDRADQLIFEYLRQNTKGFDVVQRGGNYYVQIKDLEALHKGSSELLKIVHEAKATGDSKTVDEHLEKYGNHFNPAWRDNIVRRAGQAGLPEVIAMTFPKLVPVFQNGEVVDVKLDNKESFAEQQLRFGRISKTTEMENVILSGAKDLLEYRRDSSRSLH